ncbi:MAG TPA: hypothetical protein VL096_08625, partial [Pirellulaceae bacterium]|nr:hypothetical protein [Pirellulaceae bacterium]
MLFDWLVLANNNAPRTRRRQAKHQFARRRLEVQALEERRLLATWIGGATGDWNLAANWDTANVPDGDVPGESAVFSSTAAVNFNISTAFANPIALQFDAGSGVSIAPTLPTNTLTLSSLNNNSGTNVVSAAIAGSGAVVNVASGALTLSGSNTYSGTTTASGGVLSLVATPASNPLGTSELVMNGGTAEFNSAATSVMGRFVQVINNG